MAIRIFLSHSSADEKLAEALVDCLMASLVLDEKEIRCTSVSGHKLPVGSDTSTTIRDEVTGPSVVIGLLTPQSLSSSWVLFELGAAWGSGKSVAPILACGAEFSQLPGPISGSHAINMSDENGVTQFLDDIRRALGVNPRSPAKSQAAVKKLIAFHNQAILAGKKASSVKKVKTTIKEQNICGMTFSEMTNVLDSEKVTVPKEFSDKGTAFQASVLDIFVSHYPTFAAGLHSTYDGFPGFLYYAVALKLIPFGLMKYEKLPASRAYQRVVLSKEGEKFISLCRRLLAEKQE
jgi:hypothetical protein